MIVEAVGVAAGSLDPSRKGLAERIEKAMVEAVKAAQAEGIKDPEVIRARMLEARERAKTVA